MCISIHLCDDALFINPQVPSNFPQKIYQISTLDGCMVHLYIYIFNDTYVHNSLVAYTSITRAR